MRTRLALLLVRLARRITPATMTEQTARSIIVQGSDGRLADLADGPIGDQLAMAHRASAYTVRQRARHHREQGASSHGQR